MLPQGGTFNSYYSAFGILVENPAGVAQVPRNDANPIVDSFQAFPKVPDIDPMITAQKCNEVAIEVAINDVEMRDVSEPPSVPTVAEHAPIIISENAELIKTYEEELQLLESERKCQASDARNSDKLSPFMREQVLVNIAQKREVTQKKIDDLIEKIGILRKNDELVAENKRLKAQLEAANRTIHELTLATSPSSNAQAFSQGSEQLQSLQNQDSSAPNRDQTPASEIMDQESQQLRSDQLQHLMQSQCHLEPYVQAQSHEEFQALEQAQHLQQGFMSGSSNCFHEAYDFQQSEFLQAQAPSGSLCSEDQAPMNMQPSHGQGKLPSIEEWFRKNHILDHGSPIVGNNGQSPSQWSTASVSSSPTSNRVSEDLVSDLDFSFSDDVSLMPSETSASQVHSISSTVDFDMNDSTPGSEAHHQEPQYQDLDSPDSDTSAPSAQPTDPILENNQPERRLEPVNYEDPDYSVDEVPFNNNNELIDWMKPIDVETGLPLSTEELDTFIQLNNQMERNVKRRQKRGEPTKKKEQATKDTDNYQKKLRKVSESVVNTKRNRKRAVVAIHNFTTRIENFVSTFLKLAVTWGIMSVEKANGEADMYQEFKSRWTKKFTTVKEGNLEVQLDGQMRDTYELEFMEKADDYANYTKLGGIKLGTLGSRKSRAKSVLRVFKNIHKTRCLYFDRIMHTKLLTVADGFIRRVVPRFIQLGQQIPLSLQEKLQDNGKLGALVEFITENEAIIGEVFARAPVAR